MVNKDIEATEAFLASSRLRKVTKSYDNFEANPAHWVRICDTLPVSPRISALTRISKDVDVLPRLIALGPYMGGVRCEVDYSAPLNTSHDYPYTSVGGRRSHDENAAKPTAREMTAWNTSDVVFDSYNFISSASPEIHYLQERRGPNGHLHYVVTDSKQGEIVIFQEEKIQPAIFRAERGGRLIGNEPIDVASGNRGQGEYKESCDQFVFANTFQIERIFKYVQIRADCTAPPNAIQNNSSCLYRYDFFGI